MIDNNDIDKFIKKHIPTIHQWHEGCQKQVNRMVRSLLNDVEKINELPSNRPLYKDSGLWQIRSDDMDDVLFQQGLNETFMQFIKRAHEQENEWDYFE